MRSIQEQLPDPFRAATMRRHDALPEWLRVLAHEHDIDIDMVPHMVARGEAWSRAYAKEEARRWQEKFYPGTTE